MRAHDIKGSCVGRCVSKVIDMAHASSQEQTFAMIRTLRRTRTYLFSRVAAVWLPKFGWSRGHVKKRKHNSAPKYIQNRALSDVFFIRALAGDPDNFRVIERWWSRASAASIKLHVLCTVVISCLRWLSMSLCQVLNAKCAHCDRIGLLSSYIT